MEHEAKGFDKDSAESKYNEFYQKKTGVWEYAELALCT
jgi:hypothetical protein